MLEPATFEIGLEHLIDVPWQRPLRGCPLIPKHRRVLGDELIEQRRLGPVAAAGWKLRMSPLSVHFFGLS